jgi:hypothetical protein
MRGDGALAHRERLLQLGDGELLASQKKKDAQAIGIGEEAEFFYD